MTDINLKPRPEDFAITVTVAVTRRNIANQLCAAVEGGIGYWCPRQDFKYTKPENPVAIMDDGDADGQIWPCYDYPLQPGGAVRFRADDGSGKVKTIVLNLETIAKGLDLMAKNSPWHFANIVNDSGDAETGDVLVQYIAFGEIVYG
jgi:hypothetical protein